jgi:hypothetical protein
LPIADYRLPMRRLPTMGDCRLPMIGDCRLPMFCDCRCADYLCPAIADEPIPITDCRCPSIADYRLPIADITVQPSYPQR